MNGATCFNGPQGGYMCACAMGFEGDDCESGNASLILHTITGYNFLSNFISNVYFLNILQLHSSTHSNISYDWNSFHETYI